jgi:hypothetical protein
MYCFLETNSPGRDAKKRPEIAHLRCRHLLDESQLAQNAQCECPVGSWRSATLKAFFL